MVLRLPEPERNAAAGGRALMRVEAERRHLLRPVARRLERDAVERRAASRRRERRRSRGRRSRARATWRRRRSAARSRPSRGPSCRSARRSRCRGTRRARPLRISRPIARSRIGGSPRRRTRSPRSSPTAARSSRRTSVWGRSRGGPSWRGGGRRGRTGDHRDCADDDARARDRLSAHVVDGHAPDVRHRGRRRGRNRRRRSAARRRRNRGRSAAPAAGRDGKARDRRHETSQRLHFARS